MAKLFDALEEQIVNGQSAVLLSIYKSTGSAPRGAGAHMLVTEAGACWKRSAWSGGI